MKKAILGLLLATSFALCCCKDSNVHLYSNDNKYIVDDFLTVTILLEPPQERLLSNDFNLVWIISITSKGNEPISEEASSFKLLDEAKYKTIDFEYDGPNDDDPFYDSENNYLRTYTFNATAEKLSDSFRYSFSFSFKNVNFVYHSYDK